jgi:hypothetical protein
MAALPDLPSILFQQERIVCSIAAAEKYAIPAALLLAIAEKENGQPGVWVKNSNGTQDVGALQFNTTYLKTLKKYGIIADDVAKSGCYAYDLAAWRIRGHLIKDSGDLWTRAANYHSRTPVYNQRYRADLMVKANRWTNWLDQFQLSPPATLNAYTLKSQAKPASQLTHVEPAARKTAYVPRRIAISHPNR